MKISLRRGDLGSIGKLMCLIGGILLAVGAEVVIVCITGCDMRLFLDGWPLLPIGAGILIVGYLLIRKGDQDEEKLMATPLVPSAEDDEMMLAYPPAHPVEESYFGLRLYDPDGEDRAAAV